MSRSRSLAPVAAFAAFGLFWGAWGVLLPEIQLRTGVSFGELGTALLLIAAGSIPSMLVTGALIDRFGGAVLPVALLALGAAGLAPAFSSSFLELAAGAVGVGAASGAVDVAINSAVAEREAAGGRLMQRAHAMFSAGAVVAAVTVGLVRDAGIRAPAVLGAVALVLVATAALNRGDGARPRAARRGGFVHVTPTLVLLGAVCATGYLVESGAQNWSALHLERTFDASPSAGGLAPALFAASMAAGRSAGHVLGRLVGDVWLLVVGGAVAAAGFAVAATAPRIPIAIAGFAIAGAGVSVVAPALFATAGRVSGAADRGRAIASVTTIAYVGFLIGPPATGAVSAALDLRAAMLALAGVAAALALGALSLRRIAA